MYKDDANPEWFWGAEISEEDGRYLIMSVSRDTARVSDQFLLNLLSKLDAVFPQKKNLLWIADLEKNEIGQNIRWDKLIDEFDASYD